MLSTLIAILISIGILFYPSWDNLLAISDMLTLIPIFFLLAPIFIWVLVLTPLQKAEQNITPRILQLMKEEKSLKLVSIGTIVMPLIAFYSSLQPQLLSSIHPLTYLIIWIITIGITIDLIYALLRKLFDYINPFTVVTHFAKAAKNSVENDRELDLCDWTESLSEIGIKALNRGSNSLCHKSIAEMRETLRLFFECSKSIAHETQDTQSRSVGITDKISYTLFFFLERLGMIFHKALNSKSETTCSAVITNLGKITVDAARCDLSLISYPAQSIGEYCLEAEKEGMTQIPLKGSCTLVEASKVILNDIDLTYQDLKDPFISVIAQLDAIAKETFRRNKNSNIKILIQPLQQLREEFQKDKIAGHRDTPELLSAIDAVLTEWTTLETVLRTMPPIPKIEEEK